MMYLEINAGENYVGLISYLMTSIWDE